MKNKIKFLSVFAVVPILFIFSVAYAATITEVHEIDMGAGSDETRISTPISVSPGDIITATWYTAINGSISALWNAFARGPHELGGTCVLIANPEGGSDLPVRMSCMNDGGGDTGGSVGIENFEVPISEMVKFHDNCDGTPANFVFCNSAAFRYCAYGCPDGGLNCQAGSVGKGYTSGYLVETTTTSTVVTCVGGDAAGGSTSSREDVSSGPEEFQTGCLHKMTYNGNTFFVSAIGEVSVTTSTGVVTHSENAIHWESSGLTRAVRHEDRSIRYRIINGSCDTDGDGDYETTGATGRCPYFVSGARQYTAQIERNCD